MTLPDCDKPLLCTRAAEKKRIVVSSFLSKRHPSSFGTLFTSSLLFTLSATLPRREDARCSLGGWLQRSRKGTASVRHRVPGRDVRRVINLPPVSLGVGWTERTKNSTTWLGAGDGRGQRSEIRGTLMGGHLLRWLLARLAVCSAQRRQRRTRKKSTPLATTHHTQRENKPEIEKHTF
jgi:hypothetical protein